MEKPGHTNFVSALISLAPALIQIFAFFAIELSDRLNLKNLLVNSESLLLVNFLTLITSLCAIGLYSFWKSKSFLLGSKPNKTNIDDNLSQGKIAQSNFPAIGEVEKIIYKYLKVGIGVSIASGFLLLIVVSTKQIIPKSLFIGQVILQWIAYISLLSSFSLNMYVWLEDKNTRDGYQQDRESLMSVILEKLRENGWLDELKIHFMSEGGGNKNLIINVNGVFLSVVTTFDGKQIIFVKEFKTQEESFNFLYPPSPSR